MNHKTINLEHMTLRIPQLWKKDWSGEIQNAAGVEKTLLKIQAQAANLLRQVNDERVTFARLAWLNLWTKAFAALDGTVCALSKNSLYVLRMIERASSEQLLHTRSIIEPNRKLCTDSEVSEENIIPLNLKKDRERESFKRLEAYAAWCIWNDQSFYEKLVSPETLDKVWDPNPAQQIACDLKSLEAYEAIYGQLDITMDERELKKGRLRQQDEGQHRLHRIRTWLNHTDLKPWHEKLKKDKFMTFFTLIGDVRTSVKKSLKDFDLSFCHLFYSEGSMAIHGSSMEQFLKFNFGDQIVSPFYIGDDDEVSKKAEEVGVNCKYIISILCLLINLMWPKQ